jgi:hypothetical protein
MHEIVSCLTEHTHKWKWTYVPGTHIKQWSILETSIRYVTYTRISYCSEQLRAEVQMVTGYQVSNTDLQVEDSLRSQEEPLF